MRQGWIQFEIVRLLGGGGLRSVRGTTVTADPRRPVDSAGRTTNLGASHDGAWGKATTEVCLALLQSAKERKEIRLVHQIPLPEGYAPLARTGEDANAQR